MRIPVLFYEAVSDDSLVSVALDNCELVNVGGQLYKVTKQEV